MSSDTLPAIFKSALEQMQKLSTDIDDMAKACCKVESFDGVQSVLCDLLTIADRAKKLNEKFKSCKGAKFVVSCSRCKHYTSTVADGGHCMLSGLKVDKKHFCSKSAARGDSLCWDCANAFGKCSWSEGAKFTPIDGWDAVSIVAGTVDSYHVRSCPEFQKDDFLTKG